MSLKTFCKDDQEVANITFIIDWYIKHKKKYLDTKTNTDLQIKMIDVICQSLLPYLDKESQLYDPNLIRDKDGKLDNTKVLKILDNPFENKSWEKYKKIEEERINADKNKKLEPNTTMKCNKCGGGVFCYEVQIRSPDEPTTKFYCCVKCPNNWKK